MTNVIDNNATMGVVSLSVGDLSRSLDYYQADIGLDVINKNGGEATLGAGGRSLLHLQEIKGARSIARSTGLFHFALLVPTREALGRVLRHFAEKRTPIDGASDHLVSEALYLSDPDGHGIEIYRDRPRGDWYDANGNFKMDTLRLDIEGVLNEGVNSATPWEGIDGGTVMGHVHLQVRNVNEAEKFYTDTVGFGLMVNMPSASFISAGDTIITSASIRGAVRGHHPHPTTPPVSYRTKFTYLPKRPPTPSASASKPPMCRSATSTRASPSTIHHRSRSSFAADGRR